MAIEALLAELLLEKKKEAEQKAKSASTQFSFKGVKPANQPKLDTSTAEPASFAPLPKSQADQSPAGLSDIGDAMRLITENPIEFAVPAILGVPLEQVFLGAISRQRRTKQKSTDVTGGSGVDPKKEPSILQDVLGAKDDSFIGALLGAFGIGG